MFKSDEVFVHPHGLCESKFVGTGTRIWAFAHVLPSARIGTDCNICDHVFIENDVEIGDHVTVKCGVQLWDGLRVGDRVFIGPNVTFSNDKYPHSKVRPESFLITTIEDEVSIGANATILPGLRLGRGAMVGAGSVVTRDIPPFARVVGNPAKIVGYQNQGGFSVQACSTQIGCNSDSNSKAAIRVALGVGGCYFVRLPQFIDLRGGLTPLEFGKELPFKPERIFMVYDVSSNHVRGEHAHKVCEQFLVAAHGSVHVILDDGTKRVEIALDNRSVGLYIAPMTWGIQYKFSIDCVLAVMASHAYSADDYIRDYESYRLAIKSA